MKSLLFFLVIGAAALTPYASAQVPQGAIEVHVNSDAMHEATVDALGNLWAATDGGALRFDPATETWTQFIRQSLGGPPGNDVSTVFAAPDSLVWVGSASRGVSFYNLHTDRWTFFEEVPDFATRVVRAFDTGVYIGTEAGLSLRFQPNRTEICNDINPSCIVPSFVINDYAVLGDTLWVATQDGLGRFNGVTWDSLSSLPGGSIGSEVPSLAVFESRLWSIAGNTRRLDNGQWVEVGGGGHRLRVTDDRLFRLDQESIFHYTGSEWIALIIPSMPPEVDRVNDIAVSGDNIFVVTNFGMMWSRDSGISWRHLRPPGPPVAGFHQAAAATPSGKVWFGNREGVMSYDGQDWDFIPKGTEGLDREWIFALSSHQEEVAVGHCCCNDPPRCRVDVLDPGQITNLQAYDTWALDYDEFGLLYAGTSESGAIILEKNGAAWNTVRTLTNASTNGNLSSDIVTAVAARSNRAVFGHESSGISVWSYSGDVSVGAGRWQEHSVESGDLLDDTVGAIEFHGVEDVWVGTSGGLHHFISTESGLIFFERFPTRLSGVFDDLSRKIRDIAVDDFGTVWCATDRGILFLKRGSREFEILTSHNSDIPDDDVRSAVLASDGSVWFGMARGIAQVHPARLSGGQEEGARFVVYPNPADPAEHHFITLKLAVGGTQLADPELDRSRPPEVFDPAGRKVGEFKFSSVWEWNGRNSHGSLVAPGLYVVRGWTEAGEAFKVSLGILR